MEIKSICILIITLFFLFFLSKTITENFTLTENDLEEIKFPFKSYIINLLETEEGKRRWPIISAKYPLALRWPATYGKYHDMQSEFDKGIVTEKWDFGKWKYNDSEIVKMTPGELGVIMSHYRLWKEIAKMKEPVVILEDDAIRTDELTQLRLDMIFKELPEDYDIYLLGFIDIDPQDDEDYLHCRVKEFVLMHSYIITPEGAQKLLNLLPVDMPLDTWVSSVSGKIKIYRHNFYVEGKDGRCNSVLINQNRQEKQIVNTNII